MAEGRPIPRGFLMQRTYLDYAATTPTHPDVLAAMTPFFTESFGNASSIYSYGRESRAAISEARTKVAALIGARDDEIVFTGGGTEADNAALKGVAFAADTRLNHIITATIEHHAVLETCGFLQKRGTDVTYLPVDGHGMVDPDDVRKAITGKTMLISVMHANNEVGTIQPIAEIGRIAKEAGVYFHTDAVQTVGHVPVDVDEAGIDMLSLSAHKLYGPKGVGALFVRKGTKLSPFIHGGGQEHKRRSGTENVPGIVGLGKAAEMAQPEIAAESERLTRLRDTLIRSLLERMDDTRLNGHPVTRLPSNVNISVDYVEGESMLLHLDMEGICASTGSACSSGSLEPSHVLLALGLSHQLAHGSLRFSLGKWTTADDVARVIDLLPGIVAKLRAMSPLNKTTEGRHQ
jgi:cysteine desulfurase